jgi:RAB protein geranylgeranyltransferase component A
MKNQNDFKKYSRGFNIDLAPKILFSKSLSVENLIKSGVANYLEFNNVNSNYFYKGENSEKLDPSDLVKIPFSKSEIFTNTVLTLKEKR